MKLFDSLFDSLPRLTVRSMHGFCLALALLFASAPFCRAQNAPLTLDDLLDRAQQWAEDNLDTNFLNSLSQLNDQAVRSAWRESNAPAQEELVVNLTPLKSATQGLLSVLGSNDDFHPYAAWLSAQLDELDTSDDLRITISGSGSGSNPVAVVKPTDTSAPAVGEIMPGKGIDQKWPVGAKFYVPALKAIFSAQKAPPELVWIAEIESGFDRRAVSPVGATGLFQLMPDTARRFGLSLWPFDERYKAERSAMASAKYLKVLHDQFQDWRLTLAAYNAGEGTVQKLIDRYQSRNYDVLSPHLPTETQSYVPRVEAIILDREGVKLQDLSLSK